MSTYFGFAISDTMFSGDLTLRRRELNIEQVRELVDKGVISGINPSHKGTVNLLKELRLDVEIPKSPPNVQLGPGDELIVMSVRGLPRLTDRHQYTPEELADAEIEYSLWEIDTLE